MKVKILAVMISALLLPIVSQAEWQSHFYMGGGGGWQLSNLDTTMQNIYVIHSEYSSEHTFTNNDGQALANLFAGWGAQNGPYYLALEGDVYYANQDETTTYATPLDLTSHSITTQMQWRYELDAIAGYYITPQWLAYGKLGVTTGRIEANYEAIDTDNDTLASSAIANQIVYGGVVGAGLQYTYNQHWHIGAEADYIQFAKANKSVPDASYVNWNQPYDFQYQLSQYLLKATISYSF